jgi:thymidylate synthase
MNNLDIKYFKLVEKIIQDGRRTYNRTGIDCLTIAGAMIEHDMSEGCPLLTSRKLPVKSTKVELEFFIKGLRSKKWLQERDCHYWDGWCNPQIVPYKNDELTKVKMKQEDDLGLIYGTQWRDFRSPDSLPNQGVDQLKNIINKLKTDPSDRRMICSAWNPLVIPYAALPSCHYCWQVTVIDDTLNLSWNQRSVDVCCGLPQNIFSYGLLLHLLAKESNLKEGKLIGFLMDTHIYINHVEGVKKQLSQPIHSLSQLVTNKFESIFDWSHEDSEVINYRYSDPIKFEVAI